MWVVLYLHFYLSTDCFTNALASWARTLELNSMFSTVAERVQQEQLGGSGHYCHQRVYEIKNERCPIQCISSRCFS